MNCIKKLTNLKPFRTSNSKFILNSNSKIILEDLQGELNTERDFAFAEGLFIRDPFKYN